MSLAERFLSADGRGNLHTALVTRHQGAQPWTDGNDVRPLVHGATYFRELLAAVTQMGAGDLLLFTDWRGDPDERLDDDARSQAGEVFADAARRGVVVRGLVWRSHWDRLAFSAYENRHFGEEIEAAGGQCLLDMRVRVLGSHHQKLVVLRHPAYPERDVAYVGGIDLCHGRRDCAEHHGDPQRQPMAKVYGATPPWHDVQLALRGPAVGDAEAVFRERWNDPAPLTRNPLAVLGELVHREDRTARALPAQLPDPAPRGNQSVQLLQTYPKRRSGYPFAPQGDRSVARGYQRAVRTARSLIYVEDQYLWSGQVAGGFAEALANQPGLRMIAVIPGYPDQDGRLSMPPNLLGREPVLQALKTAGGNRFAAYWLENSAGTPVYVHAKVCVIDDRWSCVGSDNLNRRSWTHDSELSCAVQDSETGTAGSWGADLRLQLAHEHLGRELEPDEAGPTSTFEAFRASAQRLDGWHAGGQRGPRPPGQLRTYAQRPLSPTTRWWATPMYRLLYDPDGRGRRMRRDASF
jgi:phosphatidylserine/phosphatidylglycerophosphate/cardiolipin synthase-like enzyme